MPCYKPLKGYKSIHTNENGKRNIVFNSKYGHTDLPITIPCGRCIGCRLEKSLQWAVRCIHEAKTYKHNQFITLTYNTENLPKDKSLNKKHIQLFIKKLRSHISREAKKRGNTPATIKYFHCGEYGPHLERPHYHMLLFNYKFEDQAKLGSERSVAPGANVKSKNKKYQLYTSKILEELWGKGFCTIGEVNFQTASYTARYILKKITGDKAEEHYKGRLPEYITMSNGIGKEYFTKFNSDFYPLDQIILMENGKSVTPAKYYDEQLLKLNPKLYKSVKRKRRQTAHIRDLTGDNTEERLETREKVRELNTKIFERNFEKGN